MLPLAKTDGLLIQTTREMHDAIITIDDSTYPYPASDGRGGFDL